MDKFSWLILITWLTGIILSVALWGTVSYIAWEYYHFVSKLLW
jgi:hypothetical protein